MSQMGNFKIAGWLHII